MKSKTTVPMIFLAASLVFPQVGLSKSIQMEVVCKDLQDNLRTLSTSQLQIKGGVLSYLDANTNEQTTFSLDFSRCSIQQSNNSDIGVDCRNTKGLQISDRFGVRKNMYNEFSSIISAGGAMAKSELSIVKKENGFELGSNKDYNTQFKNNESITLPNNETEAICYVLPFSYAGETGC